MSTLTPPGADAGAQADRRIDVESIVNSLAPLILEYEQRIEDERSVPPDLAEALYTSGAIRTQLPREYGGLEASPVDYLELVYQLSRLNGSVGWLAMVQTGAAVLLAPEVMDRIVAQTRWITAGSAGRVAPARRVDGGLRVTGRWPFASGTPHATFIQALVQLVDEAGDPVLDEDGAPQVANVVFPRADVTYHDTWDGLGLRGTSSGDIEVVDVFVPDEFVQFGPWVDQAFTTRPLYRAPFAMQGHAAHALGVARAAVDAFIALTQRPPKPGSSRQQSLGRQQMHRVAVAKADSVVRAARRFAWDATARVYEDAHRHRLVDPELLVEMTQSGIYGVRAGREALQIVFDQAGTDGVIRGRKLEQCYRDLSTAAQHSIYMETMYEAIGEYYLTRDLADGPAIESGNAWMIPHHAKSPVARD